MSKGSKGRKKRGYGQEGNNKTRERAREEKKNWNKKKQERREEKERVSGEEKKRKIEKEESLGRRNNLEPRGRVRRASDSGKGLRKKQERSFG